MKLFEVIPVYYRQRIAAWTVVDADAYERLARYRWTLSPWGYASRSHGGRSHTMHREVVGLFPGDGRVVHHVNEDPLDNRRENLLVCRDASEHGRLPHRRKNLAIVGHDLAPSDAAWLAERIAEIRARPENQLAAAA